jgi:cell division protein FtsW (lipid II flippase)
MYKPLTNVLRKKNKMPFILPFILTALPILISYLFPTDEFRSVLLFLVLIPIFAFYRFDGRIPIGYAIVLFVLAAVFVRVNERDLANQILMFDYWLLVVGCCCLSIELLRKKAI